jgi:hypothetical protein
MAICAGEQFHISEMPTGERRMVEIAEQTEVEVARPAVDGSVRPTRR